MASVSGSLKSKKFILQGSPSDSNIVMSVSNNTYKVQVGDISLLSVGASGVVSDKFGNALVTTNTIGSALGSSLSAYAPITSLSAYAQTSALSAYAPTNAPTFTGSLTADSATVNNLTVLGATTTLHSVTTETSNLIVANVGSGPAISVSQSNGTVAQFFDTGVSSSAPVFLIAQGGLASFSSNVSVSGDMSVQSLSIGGFKFVIPSGDGTTLNVVYNGSNVLQILTN